MTATLRSGLFVAICAALLGAPAAVRAAPPNQLSAPSVSPTNGSILTIFTFGVQYASSAGEAARSVTVSVGGRRLAMSRVAGSPAHGTYRAAATLPPGSWTPTFSAFPAKGPEPSLRGPQLSVTLPTTPPTPARIAAPSSSGLAMPADDPVAPPPADKPAATSAPAAAPDSAAAVTPARVAKAAPTGTEAIGSHPGKAAAESTPAQAAPADWPPLDAGSSPADIRSPRAETRSPEPVSAAPPVAGKDPQWAVVTMAALGAAALGGWFVWLLLGRRRQAHADDVPLAAGRAARRTMLDAGDDPIVAAMNLPARRGGTRRTRAGQVNEGSGERPIGRRRTPRR